MAISGLTDRAVVTDRPDETVADAARALRQHQISAVIVAEDERAARHPHRARHRRGRRRRRRPGRHAGARSRCRRACTPSRSPPTTTTSASSWPGTASATCRSSTAARSWRSSRCATGPRPWRPPPRGGRPPTSAPPGWSPTSGGPYHDGPPPKDLEVDVPSITKFGVAELRRMIVVYVVLVPGDHRPAGSQGLRTVRAARWFEAASHGAVDGFERLGPTFVKLGQLVASSPGIFPAPLATACLRCLDDVPPFPGEQAVAMITADLGKPARPGLQELRREAALGGVDRAGPRVRASRRPRGRDQAPAAEHPHADDHRPADPAPAGAHCREAPGLRQERQRRRHHRGPPRRHLQRAEPGGGGLPAGPLPVVDLGLRRQPPHHRPRGLLGLLRSRT